MPYTDRSGHKIRIFYIRYADDWVLFCNANAEVCLKLKLLIKYYLYRELGYKLPDEKTVINNMSINNMRRHPRPLLGFRTP